MPFALLLVDDEPNVLDSLKRSLRNKGYAISCAISGETALEILRARPIDIIISDQSMPGMSGTDLLARVREDFPDTIRFILTGQADLDVAMDAINKGAVTRFFLKPVNTVDLAAAIRQALQQKELLTQARRLLEKVQDQKTLLQRLERQHPGITRVERDEEGAIVLDSIPDDYDAFIAEIRATLDRTEGE